VWRVWIGMVAWVSLAAADDPDGGFRWVAHPVVISAGQTAQLTLDLHVPAGVDEVEYAVEVGGPDGRHFQLGAPEGRHGRLDRPDHEVHQTGRMPIHLPLIASDVRPGVHRVVLHARVRSCSGRACSDGRKAAVPVVVHVPESAPPR